MRPSLLLLSAVLAGAGPLHAQLLPEPPANISSQDSATIYLRAAVQLADSLAARHAVRPIAFAIPAYPQDSALHASLTRALARPPYPRLCVPPSCPRGVFILHPLERHGPALVIIPLSGAVYRAPGGRQLADLSARLWRDALAAAMDAPVNTRPASTCLRPDYNIPLGLMVGWDPDAGWHLTHWQVVTLCG